MEEVKQHPRSKRKRKNINVYFNKTKSTGQTKYITGEFQSNKCNSYVPYRSSYELKFFFDFCFASFKIRFSSSL